MGFGKSGRGFNNSKDVNEGLTVNNLTDALAISSSKEGADSIVKLISSRGGLVAVFQNLGTIASPAVLMIGTLDLVEASYGGCGITITNVGDSIATWIPGSGLSVTGATALTDYSWLNIPVGYINCWWTVEIHVSSHSSGSGDYAVAGLRAPTGEIVMGGVGESTNRSRVQSTSSFQLAANVETLSTRILLNATSNIVTTGVINALYGDADYYVYVPNADYASLNPFPTAVFNNVVNNIAFSCSGSSIWSSWKI